MRIGELGTVILGFPFIECVTFGCKWVRKVFGATRKVRIIEYERIDSGLRIQSSTIIKKKKKMV